MNRTLIIIFINTILISACSVSSGLMAINDESYFKESPKIVVKENRYFLRLHYTAHYYMYSISEIKNDTLIFYIPVTTSTGDAQGKLQFEEIISSDKIKLTNKQLAFWRNPDTKLIPLKIEAMQEELDILATSINGRKH